jgi:hypothetical protein
MPDLENLHGVTANDVLGLLSGFARHQQDAASTLWMLLGKAVAVRHEGAKGNVVLDYVDALPGDLLPLTVLDASATTRDTYRQWREGRGGIVLLKEAPKQYAPLTIKVLRHGHGKDSFTRKGPYLCRLIANTVDSIDPSEDVLIIGHLPKPGKFDVEEDVRSLIKTPQQRLHYVTWGRHDATNRFSHVRHVILAGVLNYPVSYHESLGRLCSGLRAADGPYPEEERRAIVRGEHRHLILQAVCRGTARQCEGDQCRPCTVYMIASPRSGIEEDLQSIFPGCAVTVWEGPPQPLRGKPLAAIDYLRGQFESGRIEIPFSDVQAAIQMSDAGNFKRLRRSQGFARELERLQLTERIGKPCSAFVLCLAGSVT